MLISFDTEARALYVKIKDGKAVRTEEFGREVFLDFDENGELLGIEMLNPGQLVLKRIAEKYHLPDLKKIQMRPLRKVYQPA